ncbi:uncharacterized protein FOMMEDRAFT_167613 [Fomitiporia mediterranea MF3/22]|uniref:uncharacterized protein n=1 Tax=Fomitiporia mediterranea (strain MF3/22) TaxID=694068 RepID=UPI0004407E33|nr:uncharacterized protein FOMMEDRAFT_167613 [Fomitiporia mediterranea MF3/22]EJD04424.1 hypothetical protein FOMMEDRAFT_167613 [Fomitiporia mediterranea MF3/22]
MARTMPRPPPSTQPSGSTIPRPDPFRRGKEDLSRLNEPQRQQMQAAASGSAPSQKSQGPPRTTIERIPPLPATQPAASASSSSRPSNVSSRSSHVTPISPQNIQQPSSGHGSRRKPIFTARKSAYNRPPQSQPSLSRPSLSKNTRSPLSSSIPFRPNEPSPRSAEKGKGKADDIISIQDSEDDSTSVSQSQMLSEPRSPRKTLAHPSLSQPGSRSFLSTSSGDEFPDSLSQQYRGREGIQSVNRSVNDGEREPESISRGPRNFSNSRGGRSNVGATSGPSTQPVFGNARTASTNHPPPLTQPTTTGRRLNSSTATNRTVGESSSPRPVVDLGVVEVSDDDDDEGARAVNRANETIVVDLTTDDDDVLSSAVPATSRGSHHAHVSTTDSQSRIHLPSSQPARSLPDLSQSQSPPAVRPKPRSSAIPKDKMASIKPRPAGSRPLNDSRGRSGNDLGTARVNSGPDRAASELADDLIDETNDGDNCIPGRFTFHPTLAPGDGMVVDSGLQHDGLHADMPETASVDVQEAGEPMIVEPNFDVDDGNPLDMAFADDEFDPMVGGGAIRFSRDKSSSVEQDTRVDENMKRPEETSPIARARELRSPSVSRQNEDPASPGEDANEVDLLIGPSISSPRKSVSDPQQSANKATRSESVSILLESVTPPAQETLTNKIGMMDLSRRGPEDMTSCTEVPMDVVNEKEPSKSVVTGPPCSAPDGAVRMASANRRNDETEKQADVNMIALTASGQTSIPEPHKQASVLARDIRAPREQANPIRALSPGALVAPAPVVNFMGMFNLPPQKASPTARASRNMSTVSTPSASPTRPIQAPAGKANNVDAGNENGSRLVEKTGELRETINAIPTQTASPNPVSSDSQIPAVVADGKNNVELASTADKPARDQSLSPRSRANLKMPPVRPTRRLSVPAPTFQYLRAADTRTSSEKMVADPETVPSHSSKQETVRTDPSSSLTPSSLMSDAREIPDQALCSARKPKLLINDPPGSNDSGAAKGIPSPTTNLFRAAAASGLSLRRDLMPYVKKRMLQSTMEGGDAQNSDSLARGSSSAAEPGSVSQPVPPKRHKALNTGSVDDNPNQRYAGTTTLATSIPQPVTGANALAQIYNRTSGGLHDVKLSAMSRSDKSVASSRKFPFARKSTGTSKRRPVSSSERPTPLDNPARPSSSASFRKRAISTSSASSSGDIIDTGKQSSAKRARTHKSDLSRKPPVARKTCNGSKRARQSMASNTSTMRSRSISSASSPAPMDVFGDDHSESSNNRPATPVTDLADAVSDIVIASKPKHKVSKGPDPSFSGRRHGPKWYHIKDIPRDFINEVNYFPAWGRNPRLLKDMFEQAILQNTNDDEPNAPAIQIINNVDDQPAPPFEFYYTNRLYHHENVPPPDYENLQGCGCMGKCDPQSATCACLHRQLAIFRGQDNYHEGFVYDDKGRAQIQGFPIFECNDACGCDEDCTNRVVQHGRQCHINIVKTKRKGWGIFAGKKIPKGTFIGIYSGELLVDEEAHRRGLKYNASDRNYLFDIDFWHIPRDKPDEIKYVIDAFHVGNFTRFLNHSCDPNCRINAVYINEANIDKPLLAIFTTKDLDAGQELCFNYNPERDEDDDDSDEEHSYQKCLCGARNCCGKIFIHN